MAFCPNCGSGVGDSDTFCRACRRQLTPPPSSTASAPSPPSFGPPLVSPSPTPSRNADYAVASLVLGLIGLGILAVIFARKAKKQIRANPTLAGKGMATAAEILGWIETGLIVSALFVVFLGPILVRTTG